MLPVLLDLKFIKIYTLGVFLVLALVWSMFILWRNIKLTSYKEEDIFDIFFVTIFGSLFFARLFYVISHFSRFKFDILKFILINGYPGLSLFGGLIGGIIVFYLLLYARKINFRDLIDYFMPALFIGLAVGKIGSFISGVDVGTKTKFPISVWYSGFSGARHITAVYESLLFFIGAYIAHRIILSVRRTSMSAGFGFNFFVFYFSLTNLFLDKFKENHLYFAGLNINLWLSVIFVATSGVYMIFVYRQSLNEAFTNFKTLQIHANYFKKFTRRSSQKTD